MKKKYNMQKYKKFAKCNKFVRENIRPNIFSSIEEKGLLGKAVGKIGNKLINGPIHTVTINTVGRIYNPKIDTPYKGSIYYTIVNMIMYFILATIVSFLVKNMFIIGG